MTKIAGPASLKKSLYNHRVLLRNLAIVLIALILGILYFASQGHIVWQAPKMTEIKQAAAKAYDKKTTQPAMAQDLRKQYGFDVDQVEDFIYYAPTSAMEASELLVVQFEEASQAQAAKALVEAARDKKADVFRNYKPEETAILENALLKVRGSYLIYLVSKQPEAVKTLEQGFR